MRIYIKSSIDEEDSDLLYQIAANPKSRPHTLDGLADSTESEVRFRVARHPNTSEETLIKLSKDIDNDVRCMVAKHPNTPLWVLEELSEDVGWDVRAFVAERDIPQSLLYDMSWDDDYWVRKSVAENPSTSDDVLKRLANDFESHVANIARTQLELREAYRKSDTME